MCVYVRFTYKRIVYIDVLHTHLTNTYIFSLFMIYLSPIYPINIKFYLNFISKLQISMSKTFLASNNSSFIVTSHIRVVICAPYTIRVYYSPTTNSDEFKVSQLFVRGQSICYYWLIDFNHLKNILICIFRDIFYKIIFLNTDFSKSN